MEVKAKLRFARITPRKARRVADAIRGLPMDAAEIRLKLLALRAAPMFLRLLRSAAANAQQNFSLNPKDLRVAHVLVNEGPRLKRWMPRARGRADLLMKRTSHLEVVLAGGGAPGAPVRERKTAIETKRIEELGAEELKEREKKTPLKETEKSQRAVKPTEPPRGIRRLLQRKHGE